MYKNLILIKLGGSLIAEKEKDSRDEANVGVIRRLALEISRARKETKSLITLGHGGGSFGHSWASEYKTREGIIDGKSVMGMALVEQSMRQLNSLVVSALIQRGIPAFPVSPSSFLIARDKKPQKGFVEAVVLLLESGAVPVVYGDVVVDREIGCTILSTEQILNFLAIKLAKLGFKPSLIIHVGKTEGVYDKDGKTIPEITLRNFNSVAPVIGFSDGIDVTGGMLHKVRESFLMAKRGTPSLIISGKSSNLQRAISGDKVNGTWIR